MEFLDDVFNNATFDSHLEIPTSGDPNHNAMLTIVLRYKLDFADSKNLLASSAACRKAIQLLLVALGNSAVSARAASSRFFKTSIIAPHRASLG